MTLTEQQILKERKRLGIPEQGFGTAKVSSVPSDPSESVARRRLLAENFDQQQQQEQTTLQSILGSAFGRAGERIKSAFEKTAGGEIHPLSGAVRTTGAIGGAIGEILFEGLKVITPQFAKEAIKGEVKAIGQVAGAITPEPVKDVLSDATSKIAEWAQRHPEAITDLEAILDTLNLLPAAKIAQVGGKVLQTTAKVGKEVLKATAKVGTGAIGAALEGVITAADYIKGRLPKLLGIFSGESDDVIRNALANPKLAREAIDSGDNVLRNAVREGAENSVKIKNTFIRAYSQAKQNILGESSKIVIPKNNMLGIFNKMLKKNDVVIGKNGKLDFTRSRIKANPGEVTKIRSAYQALIAWENFTINGLDRYKLLVGDLRNFATEAGIPSKSPFLGKLYHEINETLFSRLPDDVAKEFRALNLKFGNSIDLYDDVIKAFNSGDPFTKLANALGKNKDTLRQILEFYQQKTGKDILPIIAGRELALEKTAAFGFLNPRSWIDFFISPQTQGKIITEIGEKLPK